MSEAQHKSQGIVGISVMVQIGEIPNAELRIITSTFNKVLFKGKFYCLSYCMMIWKTCKRAKGACCILDYIQFAFNVCVC